MTTKATTPRELLRNEIVRGCIRRGGLSKTQRDLYADGPNADARGKLVRAACEIIEARDKQAFARKMADHARIQPTGRIVAALAAKRLAAVHAAVEAIDRTLFRLPSGKWVGGDHTVDIALIRHPMLEVPTASGESKTVWHPKQTWKGTNSLRRYVLPADWLETVHAAGIARVDDRLTLSAVPVATAAVEAAWRVITAKQSTGFDLTTESGFVVMFAGVIHFGKTIATARKKCAAEWKEVFAR